MPKPKIRIALNNSGGELSSVTVDGEENTKAALIQLLDDLPYLADGDSITVTELDV